MAYSDYGAFVYKNGIRRTDKEDAPVFSSNEETFGTDINAIPSSARIWVSLFEMKKRGEKPIWINNIHHGICGDGPIRVVCHKQGLPQIYEATEDAINEVLFYDPKEIAKYDYDQFNFEYKGYHFHFESNDPYDSNSPYIAEMIEPDGTHWRCEYDYEYGAGFEEK